MESEKYYGIENLLFEIRSIEKLNAEGPIKNEDLLTLVFLLNVALIKTGMEISQITKGDILNYYDYTASNMNEVINEEFIVSSFEDNKQSLKQIIDSVWSNEASDWKKKWMNGCEEKLIEEIKKPDTTIIKCIWSIRLQIDNYFSLSSRVGLLLNYFVYQATSGNLIPGLSSWSDRKINDLDSLEAFELNYQETPDYQRELSHSLLQRLALDKDLFQYRRFIKNNAYGMGADEFMILWDLIVKAMQREFTFCEIGIHKGQILALVELLSVRYGKKSHRYGISPMNGANTVYRSDFKRDVVDLHECFSLKTDYIIIEGFSTDKNIIADAKECAPFNILYIDGSHKKSDVQSDFDNYLGMISNGGILVVDDSNNNMPCAYGPSFKDGGKFWGIQEVSDVTDQVMNNNKDFVYIGSIVHNRVWRKL